MEILRRTVTGIEHGLISQLVNNISKTDAFKNVEEKRKADLLKKIERDKKWIKVRYINVKNQESGQLATDFTAGPGEPIYVFKFLNDEIYEIPFGLFEKWMGEDKKLPVRSDSLDESGKPRSKDGYSKRVHIFIREE